jgi:hypothetical protein
LASIAAKRRSRTAASSLDAGANAAREHHELVDERRQRLVERRALGPFVVL